MKKINIILLLIWMLVIFLFSNDSGTSSSNKSDSIANVIISTISKISHHDYNDSELANIIDSCVFFVRKSAHFLEYMLLGIFMINVLKDYNHLNSKYFLLALLCCFLYACSDEIHQLFIPGRSGRITDVLIDTTGSFFGIFSYIVIYKKLINKNHKKLKNEF